MKDGICSAQAGGASLTWDYKHRSLNRYKGVPCVVVFLFLPLLSTFNARDSLTALDYNGSGACGVGHHYNRDPQTQNRQRQPCLLMLKLTSCASRTAKNDTATRSRTSLNKEYHYSQKWIHCCNLFFHTKGYLQECRHSTMVVAST